MTRCHLSYLPAPSLSHNQQHNHNPRTLSLSKSLVGLKTFASLFKPAEIMERQHDRDIASRESRNVDEDRLCSSVQSLQIAPATHNPARVSHPGKALPTCRRTFHVILDYSSISQDKWDNRYEFQHPTGLDEPTTRRIAAAIQRTLFQLRKDDIAIGAGKLITRKEGPELPSVKIPIVTSPDWKSGPLTSDLLLVQWINKPLEQFLGHLSARSWLLTGDCGILSQRKWWMKNSKIFRFLDLPRELRLMVYEFAFCPLYPLVDGIKASALPNGPPPRVTLGAGYRHSLLGQLKNIYTHRVEKDDSRFSPFGLIGITPEARANTDPPNVNLLCTNKVIHKEASAMIQHSTRKCFFEPTTFEYVCYTNLFYDNLYHTPQFLRRIELNFSHWYYYHFFKAPEEKPRYLQPGDLEEQPWSEIGHPTNRIFNVWGLGDVRHLKRLQNLEDLQLRFRSPYDGYKRNVGSVTCMKFFILRRDGGIHTGCQKIVVDQILTLAFPHLVHIKKVSFCGYIKTSTKQKWDHIFKIAKQGGEEGLQIKHQQKDERATLLSIFDTSLPSFSSWLPPLCSCPRSCMVRYKQRDSRKNHFIDYDDFDYDDTADPHGPQPPTAILPKDHHTIR
ncbi:hypothetical protein BDV96DRAFT_598935 [Lophiotrema nucula]|uniref:Uncharacterized protein n=1 Tax=Lophiotrema nucula TaxID=690887 RepID=A0A6A5ZAS0_9PLEO|nr:hypothetical protein BDV96DRAFT_598935 [Lophiotrema nucula]